MAAARWGQQPTMTCRRRRRQAGQFQRGRRRRAWRRRSCCRCQYYADMYRSQPSSRTRKQWNCWLEVQGTARAIRAIVRGRKISSKRTNHAGVDCRDRRETRGTERKSLETRGTERKSLVGHATPAPRLSFFRSTFLISFLGEVC